MEFPAPRPLRVPDTTATRSKCSSRGPHRTLPCAVAVLPSARGRSASNGTVDALRSSLQESDPKRLAESDEVQADRAYLRSSPTGGGDALRRTARPALQR